MIGHSFFTAALIRFVRIRSPTSFLLQGEYEIYCPRCDMFFIDKEEYQDHLLIRQFKGWVQKALAHRSLENGAHFKSTAIFRSDKKVKFVEKINAVQETDNLDDMEFHDTVGFQSSSILNGSHSRLIKELIKS